jgi:hypothetical protein
MHSMRSTHAKLLQPHLWTSFILPPQLARVTKPKNIERAYARSLRPAISDLWRQHILNPTPASPPSPGGTPISAYTTWTCSARTCTAPRFASAFSPHSPPSPSFGCDAKAAPSLPTNSFPRPPAGTSPINFATVLTAPSNTHGDELHVILACPHHNAPQSHPVISALSYLLADCALTRAALTPLQHVSLLLASDPRHHLSGQDRDQWIRKLAPLAASSPSPYATPIPHHRTGPGSLWVVARHAAITTGGSPRLLPESSLCAIRSLLRGVCAIKSPSA